MEKKILNALKKTKKNRGLSLEELHKATGLSRGTVRFYVGILAEREGVTVDKIGNVKLVCLNKSPLEK